MRRTKQSTTSAALCPVITYLKRAHVLHFDLDSERRDGGAVVGPAYSHVGDLTHCVDHADVWFSATLCYHPAGE